MRLRAAAFAVLIVLVATTAASAAGGHVAIVDGEVSRRDAVWYLGLRVDYRLSDAAEEALRNGVALELRLDIEVLQPRWIWWEETVAQLAQRYRLRYHALSERYVLVRLNSGESRSFRSLRVLLDEVGRVRSLPIIDAELLRAGVAYTVAVRASLDTDALPRPLRAMAYISPQWQLASDWQRWPLHDS
ncbi:DUF4390 domain-containing protein [Arhodomonas sp. AD133]|uniref:DUF4390 domain-containing protein n=1 Tax=Arhodomonas sp. AD133 TaxID=3415009 RepID=UPI003EC01A3F